MIVRKRIRMLAAIAVAAVAATISGGADQYYFVVRANPTEYGFSNGTP